MTKKHPQRAVVRQVCSIRLPPDLLAAVTKRAPLTAAVEYSLRRWLASGEPLPPVQVDRG